MHCDYFSFFFNDTATTEIYTLSLHDALPIFERRGMPLELALLPVVESAFEPYAYSRARASGLWQFVPGTASRFGRSEEHTSELQSQFHLVCRLLLEKKKKKKKKNTNTTKNHK